MSRKRIRLQLQLMTLLFLGLPLVSQGASQAGAINTGAVSNGAWQRLGEHVTAHARANTSDLGRVSGSTPISLALVLNPRNPSILAENAKRVNNAADPMYHQFSSLNQTVANHGRTQDEINTLVQYLQDNGITVTHQHANQLVLDIQGPAASIEKAFSVEYHSYKAADGSTVSAPSGDPSLPPQLAPLVAAGVGFNPFRKYHHNAIMRSTGTLGPIAIGNSTGFGSTQTPSISGKIKSLFSGLTKPQAAAQAAATANPCANGSMSSGKACVCTTGAINIGTVAAPSCVCPAGDLSLSDSSVTPPITYCGLAPASIKSGYGLTAVNANGSGQTLGLVELDTFIEADISAYAKAVGFTAFPTITPVSVNGFSTSTPPGGGQVEVTLDIELMVALAPGATAIRVYESSNTEQSLLDIYSRISSDEATVKSISTSWGASEADTGAATANAEDIIFQVMSTQGQSFYAAAGDCGAYDQQNAQGACVTNNGLAVDLPAADPYVVAVGGTTLHLAQSGAWASETTWGTPASASGGGGGGGVSTFFSKPAWQGAVSVATNGGSATHRMVPDVSLSANPDYAYAILVTQNGVQGYSLVGGTSCAAPIWAGFTSLVNQTRAADGLPPLGFPSPTLYALGEASSAATLFHDIVSGTNGLTGATLPGFNAVAGYDLATGWGSINSGLFTALTSATQVVPGAPVGLMVGAITK